VLILVCAVVGTTVALSRLLVRPLLARLQALEQAMSRYRGGDETVRLPLRDGARDEFDEVFSEFNRMADTIAILNSERSERAQEKRKLMADLAHEINTPLTVLRGCAETLIEQEDRLDEATRSRLQAELLGQTLQVEAVVEDLLATASGESLEVPLHCGRFALDSLFDGIVDSFEPLARKRGMALVAEAGGLSIWADPARVRQMVTNLVRNALLHAQGATMIEIEAERVEDGVLIAVADDGPGLPEERRARLLERYERGGSGGLGWGLGLVIVRTLAELHGGFLRLQPSDRGARFEIWLPDRAVRAPEEEA